LSHLAAVSITEEGVATFRRGQSPFCQPLAAADSAVEGLCRVYDEHGVMVGLGELSETGEQVAPRRVLQFT